MMKCTKCKPNKSIFLFSVLNALTVVPFISCNLKKGLPYLTTTQNVVTVSEQDNISVSVSIKNTASNVLTGYSWQSSNPDIVDVVSSRGASAVFYGKKQGTAVITVKNDNYCNLPLEIIAVVPGPNLYISCPNILTITEGEDATQINAELIGGTEQDNVNLAWSTDSTGIIQLYSNNKTCSIKGLEKGIAKVVVSHPKANEISKKILVIVNDAQTNQEEVKNDEMHKI